MPGEFALAAPTFPEMPDNSGAAGISAFAALIIITAVTALLHLTGRQRWLKREAQLSDDLVDARARLDRAQLFLAAERQICVTWNGAQSEPDIEGDLTLVTDALTPRRVLGFGTWLAPDIAKQVEQSVDRLRQRGETFRMPITSIHQRCLEIEGRAVGGRAVMRIRDVSGDRLELTRLGERHGKALMEIDGMRALLDAVPDPVWMRDVEGRLTWANPAYAQAVEAKDVQVAIEGSTELLDQPARDQARQACKNQEIWRARLPAVVKGERHLLEVIDVPSALGSTAMARDLSEIMEMRSDLERQMQAHERTLDQLSTAVAIFDRKRRLLFHNSAYRQLWSLEPAFLEQNPLDTEILDHLRAAHRLPEQADFRSWKQSLLAHYQAVESTGQVWHLPDGRTLRTVISPNPQGGVTYLFDNVTERFELETRYNGLIRAQGETLDTLHEGVAVFGADGRLKLFNPAFVRIWQIEDEGIDAAKLENLHIDQIAKICGKLLPNPAVWASIRSLVSGLHDARDVTKIRLERRDDSILDLSAAPLSDGATLLIFSDVTAATNFERALMERNQALVDAQRLRNDFVHHVSYELRSPLTNIIGFTQLLSDGAVGALNAKQSEYVGYVMKSSATLLAIINDILDLATIDMDRVELSLEDIDIRAVMDSVAMGVREWLTHSNIALNVVAMDDVGHMVADGKRLRQILFNLVSNAIGFSQPGQTISMAALKRGEEIVFKVSDQGVGIAPEMLDKVFDRFHTDKGITSHRGVGLGLSIVRAFVELHGGRVSVESVVNEGTVVTCILPIEARAAKVVRPDTLPQNGASLPAVAARGKLEAPAARKAP
ncbi:MAG: PAS domain-containing sensor histidine kinase [Hyphomicrobiales bacterium]|nr:PAS domain-containing sensor histidine kinase [Hyphomicrobiales bacterium]MDE2115371.1 PAS-domain containing protein [Hyphomicrobiales bacterium]